MKKCVSCNTENEDGALFCSECGVRFGAQVQDSGVAKSMPETGTSAPEEIMEEDSLPPNQPQHLAIPPTPQPVLPKNEAYQSVQQEAAYPKPQETPVQATQQFQAVPTRRVMYDPAGDIASLKMLYRKRYPSLGVFAVLLKIAGWFTLVLYPVVKGLITSYPDIFDPYWSEEYAYYPGSMEIFGSIMSGLIYGLIALVCCYAAAGLLDYIRDREREGRIQTDIMLRTLNKK